MMGTVTVIHGDQINQMIEQITSVNDVFNAVHPQDTVLIKPNLIVSRREWTGVNTYPRVVEAVVNALKARGISRIIVGIALSADAGLGRCDLNRIKVKALNQPTNDQPIPPPVHFWEKFPCRIDAAGACCTCMGKLLFALQRLNEKGLLSEDQHFLTGQKIVLPPDSSATTIAVGQCAVKRAAADIQIDNCSPSAGTICRGIISSLKA